MNALRRIRPLAAIALCALCFGLPRLAPAQQASPVTHLTDDLDLVVEARSPRALWRALIAHPLVKGLGALEPEASPETNEELRDLYAVVEAFGPFLEEPAAFAMRARTTPRFVIVLGDARGRGLAGLRRSLEKTLPDLTLGPWEKGERKFAIEGVGQVGAVPGALVFSTHPILLRRLMRLKPADSMAATPAWKDLVREAGAAPIRALAPNRRFFAQLADETKGKPADFFGTLLFRSFLDDLVHARSARAWGDLGAKTALTVEMKTEGDAPGGWRDPGADAPLVPAGKETLLRVRLDRDLAGFWTRRLEDVPEAGRQDLAEFTQAMNVFFAGISFDEALAQTKPGMELIVEDNAFVHDENPEIVLPAFALVLRHRMDADMRNRFRVAFQTAIGIINADGGDKNRQPMLQFSRRVGTVEALGARFLADPRDGRTAIQYNLTPSIAFAGDRLIISSSMVLTERLLARIADRGDRPARAVKGDHLQLDGPALVRLAEANRVFLTDQAVLEQGLDEDEAEARTRAIIALARRLEGLAFVRERRDAAARWRLSIDARPEGKNETEPGR